MNSLFLLLLLLKSTSTLKLSLKLNPESLIRDEDLIDCYQLSNPTLTGQKVNVHVMVAVLDIDQIEEDSMEFRIHCYVLATWENENLNFTIENFKFPLVLPPNLAACLWQPDIIFPNSKEIISFQDTVKNRGFKLLTRKELYRVERYIMRIQCPMEFALYPLDTQYCQFKISLMSSPDEVVRLKWKGKSDLESFTYSYPIMPLKFHISPPRRYEKTESWITGNYTELWANITLHRRLTGSFIHFYLPSTLVVFLSWFSFYIDVDSAPARVSLGVTALLTITTQMVQARNTLPPVQYLTWLDIWLFACLFNVFASFIEFSIAYSYRIKAASGDSNCQCSFAGTKIRPIDTKENVDEVPKSGWPKNKKDVQQKTLLDNKINLDRISRWLFPFLMTIFASVYWFTLLSKAGLL